MRKNNILHIITILVLSIFNTCIANDAVPWGHATSKNPEYLKQKVVYDVDADSKEHLANIFSRTGYLSKLNDNDPFDTKIIVVIHGDAIPFFSIEKTNQYRELMKLAYSQTISGIIEFRMCKASAKLRGFKAEDIHGFITMVPMADAEIVRLQQKGYSYMR